MAVSTMGLEPIERCQTDLQPRRPVTIAGREVDHCSRRYASERVSQLYLGGVPSEMAWVPWERVVTLMTDDQAKSIARLWGARRVGTTSSTPDDRRSSATAQSPFGGSANTWGSIATGMPAASARVFVAAAGGTHSSGRPLKTTAVSIPSRGACMTHSATSRCSSPMLGPLLE